LAPYNASMQTSPTNRTLLAKTNWPPSTPSTRCYTPPAHTLTTRPLQNSSMLQPLRHQPCHLQGWSHRQHLQGWTRLAGPRSYDARHDAQPHSPLSQSLCEPGHKRRTHSPHSRQVTTTTPTLQCPSSTKPRDNSWNTGNYDATQSTKPRGTHRMQMNWDACAKALADPTPMRCNPV
jgi:hypothetical protein